MVKLNAKIPLMQIPNFDKNDKLQNRYEEKDNMFFENKIIISFEEYKQLLIYKGKYLGIIEKRDVNNVKDKKNKKSR